MNFIIIIISILLSSCATHTDKVKSPTDKKAKLYYNEGTQRLINKEYTKALKNLIQANALKPNDSKTLNNLGMAYYFKGNKDRALKYVKKSIELNPKNTDARLNLATIYMKNNELDLAEVQYKEVLNDLVYEGQFRTYFNLGVLNLKRGKKFQAINYFKQSINTNENYCPAHYELGKIAMDAGSYQKALNYFNDAGMGVCFNNPEPIYMQGLALIKMKRFNLAEEKFETIIGRFQQSRYAVLARKKLSHIKEIINSKNEYNYNAKLNSDEDLSSPDF